MSFLIDILPPSSWPLVAPVMRSEFQNAMPETPAQSSFLTALEGERLAGFVHVETLFHLQCLYVAQEYRGTRLSWLLMREAAARVPKGFSAAVLTEPSTTTRLLERLGARRVGNYDFYRRDY